MPVEIANTSTSPRLSLRPKEAAAALGISERLLWTWTNQKLIPHVRMGKAIIYPVAALEEWLATQAESAKAKE